MPLIGEMIPSRWAFEALMVEQFADNTYNQAYFPIEREKYLAQYYENIHSKEVRRLAEQLEGKDDPDKHLTVENDLPFWDVPPVSLPVLKEKLTCRIWIRWIRLCMNVRITLQPTWIRCKRKIYVIKEPNGSPTRRKNTIIRLSKIW